MSSKDQIISHFLKFPGIGPKQAERFAYFLMKQNKGFVDSFVTSINSIKHNSKQCTECFAWFSLEYNPKSTKCDICSDENRDRGQMIIVEKELDINAIERTGEYKGVYFVMGGKLPFLADDPREHIRIRELVKHITTNLNSNNENLKKEERIDENKNEKAEQQTVDDISDTDSESNNKSKYNKKQSNINNSDTNENNGKAMLREIIFALPATDEGDHATEYIKKTISQIVGFNKIKVSTLARGVSTGLEMEYIDHDTFKYAFSSRK